MRDDLIKPLTVNEAAAALGLSAHTIRAWIRQRKLTYVRLGRAIRVPPSSVLDLLSNGTVPAKRSELTKGHDSSESVNKTVNGRAESDQLTFSYSGRGAGSKKKLGTGSLITPEPGVQRNTSTTRGNSTSANKKDFGDGL
jgi:excisionase family DNA binding protein